MRTKLQASLLAVVVSVGVFAVPVAPVAAQSLDPANVGVNFHALWGDYDEASRTAVFDKLAAAKVGWIRLDLGWTNLEQAGRGKFNRWLVDQASSVLNQAQARGIKVLVVIGMTPGWANGSKDPAVPPNDPGHFALMARWAAKQFRGRVAAWEIWNEPNSEKFWAADAARYAALVRAAYPAFKAGDPKATVVVGSTVYNDDKWLAEAYDAGMGGYFDAISTHPYMGPLNAPPELLDDGHKWRMDHVRAVRELMVARGDEAKPIWFTEFGWSTHENALGTPAWELGVSESDQAEYLVRALDLIGREYPYVSHAFWYNDRNKSVGNPKEDNAGLLRRDLSEKPAYQALKAALDPAGAAASTTTSTILVPSVATPVPEQKPPASVVALARRVWWLGFLIPLSVGAIRRRRSPSDRFSVGPVRRFRPGSWN
jgi:hypothetical protein